MTSAPTPATLSSDPDSVQQGRFILTITECCSNISETSQLAWQCEKNIAQLII